MRIGLIGFGEVGTRFGADLRARGVQQVSAYDILFADREAAARMRAYADQHGIVLVNSPAQLVEHSDLLICAVTAAQALPAVQSIQNCSLTGKWLMDVNSASPQTKADCSVLVENAGGSYIESAIMTSVPPYGIKVPMLVGGPHAAEFLPTLAQLDFQASLAADEIGVASAIKLCRSVMIKGLEALVIESFTAARAFGIEQYVLESLQETYPQLDWEKQGDYLFSRVIQHGKRRAEEMQASAATVASRGIGGTMAAAIAERHAFIAEHRRNDTFADPLIVKPWRERADEILSAVARVHEDPQS